MYLTEQAMLLSPKNLVEYSRQVQDLIPIEKGVAWAKAQGVQYVVTSDLDTMSYSDPRMAERYPDYIKFYQDLKTQAVVLAEFPSGADRPGPSIRIYRM